ncbi:MAG: leucyl/phenylalanyl-tRNA--protein transferase [Taibaiella sp.]|nr:leucyl/phenylalanyl-tRNA--protein transferase [Taibaiella sp.]
MYLQLLSDELWFPPVSQALPDGLLAAGGDLSTDRLLLAYSSGIFPWFSEDEPILWWSPDPRFVLFPQDLKVSKSMKKIIKGNAFEFRFNTCFAAVIASCKQIDRKDQPGTWITEEIAAAYTAMHEAGYAHSAEAWQDGKLVGGLYGVMIGKAFFGESMFSRVSNASKYAFICWVQHLQNLGIELVDCQVYTEHLESLGAQMIPRTTFIDMVKHLIEK